MYKGEECISGQRMTHDANTTEVEEINLRQLRDVIDHRQLHYRSIGRMDANCVKNSVGKIVKEEDRLMEVCRAQYDVLSNKEFTWDRVGLTDVNPVCGPSERISVLEADVCNAVVKDGKIPEDWSRSWMVNVYKGKGDALACGSYRVIKLLEHAMKVLERVLHYNCEHNCICDSDCDFVPKNCSQNYKKG